MQKITPFLWYNDNAEEAINFYSSIFKNVRVINEHRTPSAGADKKGKLFTATIEIEGQELMLLNGGPMFKFTEAISLFVSCKTQDEVDEFWEKLSAGGSKSQCGWLKDKYGLSWQIIPEALGQLLGSPDPATAKRVMDAMMKMSKIVIKDLEAAAGI